MQNLWQRLKPVYKKKILSNKETYPHSIERLQKEFVTNLFWTDLKVDTVKQTFGFTHNSILDVSLNDFMYGTNMLKPSKNDE
tara:strand:+ start:155 stop:400 length:246 start_codon:yes stop_codon:yes gene_type:complete